MPKHCLIRGCKSNNVNGFPFPIERPTINTKWIKAIEKHQRLSENFTSRLVCPAHFLEVDFLKSKAKPQIAKKAVPSIFPDIIPGDESDGNEHDIPTNSLLIVKEEPEDIEDLASEGESDVEMDSESEAGGEEEDESEEDDGNFEYMEEDEESHMRGGGSQNSGSNAESARNIEGVQLFEPINSDEEIDSDYEPVTDHQLQTVREKCAKKTESLRKDRATLTSMEEMIQNQADTIVKLEAELQELIKAEEADKTKKAQAEQTSKSGGQYANSQGLKTLDYSNNDLQLFAIALFYFSPKVYAYLGSIIPYLPPKSMIVEWVKTGHATKIFPAGVVVKEKFNLD